MRRDRQQQQPEQHHHPARGQPSPSGAAATHLTHRPRAPGAAGEGEPAGLEVLAVGGQGLESESRKWRAFEARWVGGAGSVPRGLWESLGSQSARDGRFEDM